MEDNRTWWDQLARDKFVSEAVRGHRMEFDSRPPVSLPTSPPPQRMGKEKRPALQQEVLSLLKKGAVEPVRDKQVGFYSNLLGRSPDRSFRLPQVSLDKKDRRAAGINALVQPWNFSRMYVFPPHQLIPLVLVRMKEIKGVLMLR